MRAAVLYGKEDVRVAEIIASVNQAVKTLIRARDFIPRNRLVVIS
jgi:stage V sporulation protein SpoVS